MDRLINPPLDELSNLPTPLTDGERQVVDLFHKALPPTWEIYIQPHLNGLRPDVVLLNPKVGVAVYEVKDWDLEALHYFVKPATADNNAQLMAREKGGKVFSLEKDNPVRRIRLYENELFELYCPRLDDRAGHAVITAGLIFPKAKRRDMEQLLTPLRDNGMGKHPQYYPIVGADTLAEEDLDVIFPGWRWTSSKYMSERVADDLRGWLKEPAFSQQQRRPLQMDSRQRSLATSRTETGYRRIKGPAGSGKSVVLAARAAELASEGLKVLVVTYNITLLNYLRDLAVRHPTARRVIRQQIDFLNFHAWCKRVCTECRQERAYSSEWAASAENDELCPGPVLRENLARLMIGLYGTEENAASLPRYDAILVDEGQDFHLLWWQALRQALAPNGEMMLVADKTQNIYSTASAWTEDAMANAGFSGPWAELKTSYRLPPKVITLAQAFAKDYLAGEDIDVPQPEVPEAQMELPLYDVELRWVQVHESTATVGACVSEITRMMQRLRQDTAIPDITFLAGTNAFGQQVVGCLEQKHVHALNTFDSDKRKARRQKRAFFLGDAKVKATTLHSFKGWEARHLVLFVGRGQNAEDRALVYTALTRVQRHDNGSALSVVCSCPELAPFGQGWPTYIEARSDFFGSAE